MSRAPARGADMMVTPETRLVYATAGREESADRIAQLTSGSLNWHHVFRVALEERAAEGVHSALAYHAPPGLPADVSQAFNRAAMGSRVRLVYMAKRLGETCKALSSAGIPVVLLKGAAVARSSYRSAAERPMSDLDLLVPVERAAQAFEIALANGWTQSEYMVLEDFYARHHHLPPLRDAAAQDVALELHTDVLAAGHPFRFGAADVWDRAYCPDARDDARVPSVTHQALHLCVHFAWSHMLAHGAWRAFRDLHQLASRGGLNWHGLADEARARHASSACYWTLYLAGELGGIAVPPDAMAMLRPARSNPSLQLLARHLLTVLDPLGPPCPSVWLHRRLLLSALRDDIRGRNYQPPWERDHLFVLPGAPLRVRRRQHFRRQLTRLWLHLRYGARLLAGG